LLSTDMFLYAVLPWYVAVTVTLPWLFPSSRPAVVELIEATVALLEVHVAVDVTFGLEPSDIVTVAVNVAKKFVRIASTPLMVSPVTVGVLGVGVAGELLPPHAPSATHSTTETTNPARSIDILPRGWISADS